MKQFKLFLRGRWQLYIFSLVLALVTLFTFYLHDLDLAPFWDSVLFCGTLLFLYTCLAFYRWLQKYQRLQLLQKRGLQTNAKYFLPVADTTNEALLQKILMLEVTRLAEMEVSQQQQKQELLEDFGLWLHQIKTPVAALDLLIQTEAPAQAMKTEVFKINDYLQLLLNYLRTNLDQQDFVFQTVAVEPLVKQTVKKYATFFSQKNLTLQLKSLTGSVTTDPKWAQFILEQILFNAIKYTKDGTITLWFSENQLHIADTGIGILPEDLPRVFEKGYTGFNGRTQQRASGLGLYLSKTIAKKIGCQITIESKVNHGTTVTVSFPTTAKLS